MDFSKGSELFIFMQDLFLFMKKNSTPKADSDFFDEVFTESEELAKKYANTNFYDMAVDFIVAFQNQLERELKNVQ